MMPPGVVVISGLFSMGQTECPGTAAMRVKKAPFIVGADYEGALSSASGAVGMLYRVPQGDSIRLQIRGSETDLIMLVMNESRKQLNGAHACVKRGIQG